MFLEQWSLADCAYHFSRLNDPKLDSKRSIVSFGSGLDWDLTEVKGLNGPETTLVVQGSTFYNSDKPSPIARRVGQTGLAVFCQGLRSDDVQVAADWLFTSLFYIELIAIPDFFVASERAHVCLQCRVPPGPALTALVSDLHRRQTALHYRGDDRDPVSELLVTPNALARCRGGGGSPGPWPYQCSPCRPPLMCELMASAAPRALGTVLVNCGNLSGIKAWIVHSVGKITKVSCRKMGGHLLCLKRLIDLVGDWRVLSASGRHGSATDHRILLFQPIFAPWRRNNTNSASLLGQVPAYDGSPQAATTEHVSVPVTRAI